MPQQSSADKSALDLYEPINVLKPVAADLWIVDGPRIGFGVGPFEFPSPPA
jgi:hypothetical protein